MTETAPLLTIAVIDYQLRGYPEDCLNSLGTGDPSPDVEVLLVTGDASKNLSAFPDVRVLTLSHGDRATAKNLALKEARGEFILFTTADVLAKPNAIRLLREFVESSPTPVVASAQMLTENGMRNKTRYAFPSLLREINPFAWIARMKRHLWRKGRPPVPQGTLAAEALRTMFLMGRRDVFEKVGPFGEGFRFDHEDIEWCWRARAKGIARHIVTQAHAFKIAPQLHGLLPPEVWLGITQSRWRLVAAMHGSAQAAAYVFLTREKSFYTWAFASLLNLALFGCSMVMMNKAAAHGAIWRSSRGAKPYVNLSPDIESHVRWEREL